MGAVFLLSDIINHKRSLEIRSLQEELNKQKIHSQEEREKLKAELTTHKKWYQFWK